MARTARRVNPSMHAPDSRQGLDRNRTALLNIHYNAVAIEQRHAYESPSLGFQNEYLPR